MARNINYLSPMVAGGKVDKKGIYHGPEEVAGYKAGLKQGFRSGAAYAAKKNGNYKPKKSKPLGLPQRSSYVSPVDPRYVPLDLDENFWE